MNYKRCITCKHWDRDGLGDTSIAFGLGICRAVPMFWNSTRWKADSDGAVWTESAAGTTAFAQDGSDYQAFLYTKAEHGCTMHEAAA